MKFNEILKNLRKRRGLTQGELANALYISKSTICMYELGEREPDMETIIKIAKYLNVTIEYLLGVNDTSPESDRQFAEVAKAVKESEERSRQETANKLQNYLTCDRQEKPTDDGELEEYSEQEKALISAFRRADEEGKLRIIQISMNLADEAEKKSNTTNTKNA